MTPPPGPHAMTAQAGAVGYVDGERIHELREGRLNLALWAECCGNANTPVYTTPPAAVPVEALEGLVREMQQVKTATGRRSPTADHCANLLLTLIKERSNG